MTDRGNLLGFLLVGGIRSMSRSVVGGSCRMMEVECELPDKLN